MEDVLACIELSRREITIQKVGINNTFDFQIVYPIFFINN